MVSSFLKFQHYHPLKPRIQGVADIKSKDIQNQIIYIKASSTCQVLAYLNGAHQQKRKGQKKQFI